MMRTVQRVECECKRCGYKWIATTEGLPKRCANPKCRTPYWMQKRVVYVASGYPDAKSFKIGCTECLKRRYASKRSRDEVIIEIPCTGNKFELEAKIHELFLSRRTHPMMEQFALSKKDLAILRAIARSKNPEEYVADLLKKRVA